MKQFIKKGFTLVELVVALAIVAVLAMIGIPTYQKHVRTAIAGDALSSIFGLAADLESWRVKFKNYAGYEPQGYSYPYFWPKGSTATNYEYKFKIVDNDNVELKSTDVSRQWHIYAFPNTSINNLKYADAIYINSSDEGCFINRDDGGVEESNISSIDCDPNINSKAKPW